MSEGVRSVRRCPEVSGGVRRCPTQSPWMGNVKSARVTGRSVPDLLSWRSHGSCFQNGNGSNRKITSDVSTNRVQYHGCNPGLLMQRGEATGEAHGAILHH